MRKLENERLNEWLFEKPLRNSFLVTLAFFCLLFLIFHPRFDTNDDVRQAMIASGVGITDSPNPHILFPHIYLGEILSSAYTQLPSIPWYGLMLYGALFAGVCLLVFALLKQRKSPWLWILWAVLPLALNIQYTGVAFILTMGGAFAGLSLIRAPGRTIPSVWQLAFPLLLVFASLIRWEAFLLAFGLIAVSLFVDKRERRKGGEMAFYAGFIALAIGFLLHQVHGYHYDHEAKWEHFRKHNALRGEITDYDHIPFNDKTTALYQEVGWTASAFQLYQSWFLADQHIHSIEKLETLNEAKKWHWRLDANRLTRRLISLPKQNLFAGLLLIPLLFGFLLLGKKRKKTFLLLFGFSSALLLYLAFSQWLHNRISLPVMAFLLFWVNLHQAKKATKGLHIAILGVSILYFSAYLYRDFQEYKRMNIAEEQIEQLASNEDTLIAIWADSFPYEYVFRPFQENRKLLQKTSLLPLGMTVYTPFFKEKMEAHGFSDIHEALRDSNTVWVARPGLLPAYQGFMEAYYGRKVIFKPIYTEKEIQYYAWKVKTSLLN